MTRLVVSRWAAWSPGIETEEDWRAFAREPRALEAKGAPELPFLPALQRRRCDQLSRMMLHVAHACCNDALRSEVVCVFASRYGSCATTVALLEDLAADAPLSPIRFSHSVHNTQAGLFSIWARNSRPSASLSAGAETFAHGFLEAACALHREAGRPVLFVAGDEPVPERLAPLAGHGSGALAIGLLLAGSGPGTALDFRLEAAGEGASGSEQRHELAFLRWLLSGEETLRLSSEARAWVWTRAP